MPSRAGTCCVLSSFSFESPLACDACCTYAKGDHLSSVVFHNVSFGYESSADSLFSELDFGVSEGWTGVIGANGAGKTTLLRLACGELAPRCGRIHHPAPAIYCAQRTDAPMKGFEDLLACPDGHAYRIRGQLGVETDWLERWSSLSHGERKRAQIATALWAEPDLLAVDEPTNHLDRQARDRVGNALRSFRGIGLLVSHDRDLLDELCDHCLFVSDVVVALRSGGYTVAREAILAEDRVLREARDAARRMERRLGRELSVRREQQRKADQGRSKRGLSNKDHDAKEKVDRARVADAGAGKRLRQLQGRISQARAAQDVGPLLRRSALGIDFSDERSQRNWLFRLPGGVIELGETRRLVHDELAVRPADRVALVGPNGSGKSTLIRWVVSRLDLGPGRLVYMPQEIDARDSARILDEARALSGARLGRTMAWVSRLGSDPSRLLGSGLPSPGELRKLLLAFLIARAPQLIVLDEPTNHLDLPSIECIEEALREVRCGLLLVSHDERFLDRLTTIRWSIEPSGASTYQLVRRGARSSGAEGG
jgi:macrolide transport system ATP-binding/permease protein